MRRMSFALTRDQLLDGSKTVTRRKGWRNLKPGDRLLAVSKCMGLRPGESAEVYGPIEVVGVRREPLHSIELNDVDCMPGLYAGPCNRECIDEGFENMLGGEFVDYFCRHMGGDRGQMITRIEFRRVEPRALDGVKLSPAMVRVLLNAYREPKHHIPWWGSQSMSNTIGAMGRRGLIERVDGKVCCRLTDLGRQVAAELREGAQ